MASKLPVVKQVSFLSVIIRVVILLLMMFGFYQVDKLNFIFYSLGGFVVLLRKSRSLYTGRYWSNSRGVRWQKQL